MSYQREYEKRLDIAVVGLGGHSYRNILPALNFLPVRLKAVCDVNAALARQTATQLGCNAYDDAAALYRAEKLDAVLIVVSPRLHPELVMQAFAAGLDVWVEKPIATRTSEVEAMIAARGKRICVVGLKKVFMPAAQKALEIIRSDKYGSLVSALGVYPVSIPADGAAVL
ncbi:MAG TPA: Gfo/Idh/MocA family oxidoreductase, partial [Polyangiaceae bacterium]|nr:Gfo/Idh/MocA family oxidoreductase [Polyangiaceae bacterium]